MCTIEKLEICTGIRYSVLTKAGGGGSPAGRMAFTGVCLRISHSTYFVHSEDEMPKEQQEQYEALVRKRGEHIPLQQLTGEAWFYGIPFL